MQSARDKESDRHQSSRLSITACFRCREQKLKCGRENPVCGRCHRLSADCAYPAPPDRRGPRGKRKQKLLRGGADGTRDGVGASQLPNVGSGSPETLASEEQASNQHPTPRASTPRIRSSRHDTVEQAHTPSYDAVGCTPTGLATEYPVLSNSYQNQLRTSTSLASGSTLESSQPPPLPPTSLGLALLEIYFARMYNASILFHKPLLFQQYIEGKVHRALLRTLFALATLFIQPKNCESRSSANSKEELKILSVYQSSGLPWAKAALEEATHFTVLELANLTQHISVLLLGFDKRLPDENGNSSASIDIELGRRCFWACWISTCIVMEPEPYIDSAWKQAAMLPLPGFISSTSLGYTITYNQIMDKYWHAISVDPRGPTSDTRCPTPAGSLIKIVGVWAKVQLLCKDRPASITSGELTSVHHFSHLATLLFDDATSVRSFVYQHDNTLEAQNLCLFHDAIYHQCQVVLHSLLVPLFSGIPGDRNLDNHRQTQIKAAETVLSHADRFAELLVPYLHGDEDVSRLPPLLGYGAFVVSMVFLSTEAARRNQPPAEGSVNANKTSDRLRAVKVITRLLDTLRAYWRALQQPWEVLSSALQAHLSESREQTNKQTLQRAEQSGNDPQKSGSGGNAREPVTEARNSSLRPMNEEHGVNANMGEVTSGPYTGGVDLFADSEWYGLSLVEAGVEQFAGYEPSSLFQQGWKTFS
ncbi:Fungal transcriptional regulatory protein [Akanthomyces lecanii RCEF 1005]|uniref:Fungal transcriptional regulatory protein n=1 Tax=Akanthomyces lecanii RCEF 1005 TaxID=1081108 RepID=A0A168IHA2_CORDF|nr:Fungal transcriptional regulatory protein [Akanthomyces lecanii RCEF 1005]